ncbi:DUF3048 domain-containing protein [Chloroflexota bacterium]
MHKNIVSSVVILLIATGCTVLDEYLAPLPTLPPTMVQPTRETATILPSNTSEPVTSPLPTHSPTQRPTRNERPSATPSPTIPPIVRLIPQNFQDYANPLTGLPIIDPSLVDRKPVIVKISNYPHSVRPQWGLSLADHVFEYYLEDGLTRFAAVFFGNNASQTGPIRSGRIFDATLLQMYNAIMVFNGADQKVVDYFNELDLTNRLVVERPGLTPLWREPSLPEPHNLFGDTSAISSHVSERGSNNQRPDLVTNSFYSLGNYGKDWAMQVYINYSYANYAYWEYDLNANRYIRYQGSADNIGNNPEYQLLTDNLTGQTIAADNLIVLFVPHEYYYRSSDTEIFDIKLIERGDAYIFRDGKGNAAFWSRTDLNKPLTMLDTNGGLYPLKPGITFFQIIHTDSTFSKDNSNWTFDFARPTPPPEEGDSIP